MWTESTFTLQLFLNLKFNKFNFIITFSGLFQASLLPLNNFPSPNVTSSAVHSPSEYPFKKSNEKPISIQNHFSWSSCHSNHATSGTSHFACTQFEQSCLGESCIPQVTLSFLTHVFNYNTEYVASVSISGYEKLPKILFLTYNLIWFYFMELQYPRDHNYQYLYRVNPRPKVRFLLSSFFGDMKMILKLF